MTQDVIRVAVNGYGVIGKRVVEAVRTMPDMELVGAMTEQALGMRREFLPQPVRALTDG